MAWQFGTDKVVTLMTSRHRATMPPEFAQMEGYWQALRQGGDALPNRAQFDPRGISDLLGKTLLLERVARGEARIRLAGMALHDILGMALHGMPLSAVMTPEAREALSPHLEAVFERPAILHLQLEGESGFARRPLRGEMLLMPMLGNTGLVDRALGCLVTEGAASQSPRRFHLKDARLRPITPRPDAPAVEASAPVPAGVGVVPRETSLGDRYSPASADLPHRAIGTDDPAFNREPGEALLSFAEDAAAFRLPESFAATSRREPPEAEPAPLPRAPYLRLVKG